MLHNEAIYLEAFCTFIMNYYFFLYEGVCMSAFIMSKVDEDDHDVLNQLEEMYQVLSCMKFPFFSSVYEDLKR